MGMLNEAAANSDSNERVLLYDLWKLLRGEEREEVKLEDVRVVIMGILRMSGHKRIGVEKPEEAPEVATDMGFYNDYDQFCLTMEDIPRLQKHFELLFLNRIHYLGKMIEQ